MSNTVIMTMKGEVNLYCSQCGDALEIEYVKKEVVSVKPHKCDGGKK